MAQEIISSDTQYVDTWSNVQTDAGGYAFFDGTDKDDAPAISGASFPFYVKGKAGVVAFDPAEHISRCVEDYTGRVENGYLNYDDGSHILLQDAEHPDDQYDVEIVADDAFYQAVV